MNEEIVTKLATESIKPVSTVVDALLGPKLERIKIAARKREIAGRLDHAVVNDLLDQYLRSLIRRVSEITTIVFPNKTFPYQQSMSRFCYTPSSKGILIEIQNLNSP